MDFISIAAEQHRWLRKLDQMLADDDDGAAAFDASTNTGAPASFDDTSSYSDGTTSDVASRPLFSPRTEGELFMLATNFLLYVSLVLVVILVCKIYFPEALQPRVHEQKPRNYKYRVAEEQEYYGSDEEDDSSEENNDDSRNDANNFLEFQQESLSKTQVMTRLFWCCVMLNVTFVTWGILQERMLTRRYPRQTGEYFIYSYALVFTNRFWTMMMSLILLWFLKPRRSQSVVIYEYSFPSISNMLSSWCQYEALRYVSFPAVTLFKSFKLAPVMLMGKILGNKSYPQYDYFVSVMIGIGIAMFMTSTDDLRFDFNHDVTEIETSSAWTGVMLLFLFLFFDSFTSQFQSRMFQRHHDLSMVELLFATSTFSTVLSFITLLHTKELYPAYEFVKEHSEIHLHFLLFSVCSTIGQLFIFYTIKNFGAVVFAFIMTTRVLISIATSCILYDHQVSATGFFGLMLVMAAVLYRIRRKAQGEQLLKWAGMEDASRAYELVHEWHEHVDM